MSDNRFGDIEVDSGTEGFVCLDLIDCSGQYGYIPKDKVIQFVDKVKEIAGVDGWISVDEKPILNDRVLVCSYGNVMEAIRTGAYTYERFGIVLSNVTQWMPLPTAPTK